MPSWNGTSTPTKQYQGNAGWWIEQTGKFAAEGLHVGSSQDLAPRAVRLLLEEGKDAAFSCCVGFLLEVNGGVVAKINSHVWRTKGQAKV